MSFLRRSPSPVFSDSGLIVDQISEFITTTLGAKDQDEIELQNRWQALIPVAQMRRQGAALGIYFVSDYLRPAALSVGVQIPSGHRFGFHNLRASLSNWLVNKRKENPKTVQGILRHARIQTTLDLYTELDLAEMQAAQGAFLDELEMPSQSIK